MNMHVVLIFSKIESIFQYNSNIDINQDAKPFNFMQNLYHTNPLIIIIFVKNNDKRYKHCPEQKPPISSWQSNL